VSPGISPNVLELAGRRRNRDQARNGFEDQPKAVLACSGSLTFNVARAWMA
jgi:hypothetical protein